MALKIYEGYHDDIRGMVADISARRVPRPLCIDVFEGPDPSGQTGLYVVATWKHGDEVFLAWAPVASDRSTILAHRSEWVGVAKMAGLTVYGGVADPRAWPVGDPSRLAGRPAKASAAA